MVENAPQVKQRKQSVPSEGVDTLFLVRGWTLFMVRVEKFSGLGHADVYEV